MKRESLSSIVDIAIHAAEDLENELSMLISTRERSVGMDLKRVNYRIAGVQNSIAVVDKRRAVAPELAKAHLTQEEYLDEEFRLMHVEPHITHLKLSEDSYYSVVTVATEDRLPYIIISKTLNKIYAEGYRSKRRDLGAFLIDAFTECHCGVALCHHKDQFNRERGRIIAKGRLFKLMRKEGVR